MVISVHVLFSLPLARALSILSLHQFFTALCVIWVCWVVWAVGVCVCGCGGCGCGGMWCVVCSYLFSCRLTDTHRQTDTDGHRNTIWEKLQQKKKRKTTPQTKNGNTARNIQK